MSILSVLIAAVTTYTIPSGTTYTLQPSDPNITAETLVNIESGAMLDLNGRTQTLVGFTGSGVVTNGTAMMTLAGGPYRFDGLVHGTLQFDKSTAATPDEEFVFVVGTKQTLADAIVHEPATAVHPLRFAKNVGRFLVNGIRFADGPTLMVEDEAGLPIDIVFGVNNASAGKMKVAGSGSLYLNNNANFAATTDLTGLTGKFGIWQGRDYRNDMTFPSALKEFVMDRTIEPCELGEQTPVVRFQLANTTTPFVWDTDIFVRRDDSPLNTYPAMDVDQPTDFRGRLRIGYLKMACSANCTNIIFRHGYAGLNGSTSEGKNVELEAGFSMGSLALWTYANSKTLVKTIGPGGQTFGGDIHVRAGAYYAKLMYRGAPRVHAYPGSTVTLMERYGRSCAAGTEVHLDGCTWRLVKPGASGSYYVLTEETTNLKAYLGANPVRIFVDYEDQNPFTQGNKFAAKTPLTTEPDLPADGGVDFYGSGNLTIASPWTIKGPFRISDGCVAFDDTTENKNATAAVSGTGDVVLGNARISTYDGGRIADSSRLVYEGSATVQVRAWKDSTATRTVTVGPASATKDTAVVRRGRGVLVFGDNNCPGSNSHVYDPSKMKAYVNGGLTTDPNGRIPDPVFTACFPVTQYTQIDFATIDANNLIAPFAGYADDDFTQGADSVVRVTANMTLPDDATVAGLNVRRADLTIADGKTLTIDNGDHPAVVIVNNDSSSRSIAGNGTLDFGDHEGVVMVGQKGYGSGPFIIGTRIAGTKGVTFAGSRIGYGAGVRLTNANTYTGGTWVNCAIAYVRNGDAFSTGDIHLANGRVCGGRLDFDQVNVTVTNRVIGGGFGPWHNYSDSDSASSTIRFAKDGCCLAGPLELVDKARVRVEEGAVATISGVVSGERLQLFEGKGRLKLTAANVHTGGTEVVRSTLVVSDPRALGFGDVMIDGGVLRFENEEPITVTNLVWGVGTIQLAGAEVDFTNVNNDPNIDSLTIDVAGGARRINRIGEFQAITNTAAEAGSLAVTAAGVNVFTGALDPAVTVIAESGAVVDFGCRDIGTASLGGDGTFRRGTVTLDGDIEPGGPDAIGTLRFDPAPTFGPNAKLVAEVGKAGVDKLVVADDADISGLPLVLKRLTKDVPATKGTIFESEGTRTGEFESVEKPQQGRWAVDYVENLVNLSYSPAGLMLILR